MDRRKFVKLGAAIGASALCAQLNGDEIHRETGWYGSGSRGAVAGGGAAAVSAANAVIQSGGNAADAAATMLLALCVTDSSSFCFGGEVPIMCYDAAAGKVEVIAGMGAAPKLATIEHFQNGIPRRGPESAAVPAALDAIVTLLTRHGNLTFAAAAAPALELLRDGNAEWHGDLAATIEQLIAAEKKGSDRVAGLRAVSDCFYRGPVASALDEWFRGNGWLIRAEDLAAHTTRIEEPVMASYRGYTVCKCGPWTQGPSLLEALEILEGYDIQKLGRLSPQAIHTAVEALKLAFADRDVYYADPLFEPVPVKELLSAEYAALRRKLIDPLHASLELQPGDPVAGKALLDPHDPRFGPPGVSHDTTTCLAADAAGNFVAATPSGWSGALAGRTGVWLGSRLQSFNNWPHSPNRIAPGKRPRITLSPTLVLKAGRPVLAVSVAGGDGQDQATLQLVMNQIDFALSPRESVSAPRFGTYHHIGSFGQTPPSLGSLVINREAGDATIAALESLGHKVRVSNGALWSPCALHRDESGEFHAAGDPRAGRHAAAV
jgi:gamma-glutamyltranspeptidase/glutathione hydrolase